MDIDNEIQSRTYQEPWYSRSDQLHPFIQDKKLILGENKKEEALRTHAFFPWTQESLQKLWNGEQATQQNITKWKAVVSQFADAIAIGADTSVFIVWLRRKVRNVALKIPEIPDTQRIHTDTVNVAWVLSPSAIDEPLLVLSRGSILWIYNPLRRGVSSYLRGHGGAITHIAVHPTTPHIFCSTSRDTTVRIYDLQLTPHQGHRDPAVNPHWPPGIFPSRAGAPHGLYMNEPEGQGIGRCVMVLMGQRSGGHLGAVLHADFHPTHPIIATCGIDRCVKIWHVQPHNTAQITRADKPLFSSSRIHRSRVLSVKWLTAEVLMSHCPSAILRNEPNDVDNKDIHLAPGEIVVWKWLSLQRFFPREYWNRKQEGKPPQILLRGCASDYEESASFNVVAAGTFPDVTIQGISPSINIYQSPNHEAVALYTLPAGIPFFPKEKKVPSNDKSTASISSENWNGREAGNAADTSKNIIKRGKSKGRRIQKGAITDENQSTPSTTPPIDDDDMSSTPPLPDNTSDRTRPSTTRSSSAFPPDEKDYLEIKRNGSIQKYAGVVTLVHLPSLPTKKPPLIPLDNISSPTPKKTQPVEQVTNDTSPSIFNEGPTPTSINPANDGIALDDIFSEPESVLKGISEWNCGVTEVDPTPPMTGWPLKVSLTEEDLEYELPLVNSNPNATLANSVWDDDENDAMDVDINSPIVENVGGPRDKDKRKEIERNESEGVGENSELVPQSKVRLQAAAMGMEGRLIVVLGTRGRLWVFKRRDA